MSGFLSKATWQMRSNGSRSLPSSSAIGSSGTSFALRNPDVGAFTVHNDLVLTRRLRQPFAIHASGRHIIRRRDRLILTGFVDLHRLTIEIRVGEMASRAAEMDQSKIELASVLVNAGSPADDLLELGH